MAGMDGNKEMSSVGPVLALLNWAKAQGALHVKVEGRDWSVELAFPPPAIINEVVKSVSSESSERPKPQPRPIDDPDYQVSEWANHYPMPRVR